MYGDSCDDTLYAELQDPMNPATATYHNLYAIITVVTAFVAMESTMPATFTSLREEFRFKPNGS